MATANERLLDGQIGHQVDLQRYSNGVVRRIIGLLNRTDADLFAQIAAALERLPADAFSVERLDALLLSVRQLNVAAYQQIERELNAEMRALVEYEAGFQQRLFESVVPAQIQARIAVAPVHVEQVYTAATPSPSAAGCCANGRLAWRLTGWRASATPPGWPTWRTRPLRSWCSACAAHAPRATATA